jgi:hypothetical protein
VKQLKAAVGRLEAAGLHKEAQLAERTAQAGQLQVGAALCLCVAEVVVGLHSSRRTSQLRAATDTTPSPGPFAHRYLCPKAENDALSARNKELSQQNARQHALLLDKLGGTEMQLKEQIVHNVSLRAAMCACVHACMVLRALHGRP